MATVKRILAIDFGSHSIKVGEFQINKNKDLLLLNYGIEELYFQQHEKRFSVILETLKKLLKKYRIRPAPAVISLSNTHFFSLKLPPSASEKIPQMVHFEARQYLSFPIEDAVLDYIVTQQDESPSVLLMALERDTLEETAAILNHLKISLLAVDAAPLALQSILRHNYPEAKGCSIILDIGDKKTHMVFTEKENFFYQDSYIAGHLLSKNISKELHEPYDAAESLKKEKVALEEKKSSSEPLLKQVNEVVQSALSRLHLDLNNAVQVAETLNTFSSQKTLFLAGGTSIISGLLQFLNKKTKFAVEKLNSFKKIGAAPLLNQEALNNESHHLAVVTGLALRTTQNQKVDLLPPSVLKERKEQKRKPWLVGAVILWVLAWSIPILTNLYSELKTTQEIQNQIHILNERQSCRQTLDVLEKDIEKKRGFLTQLEHYQERRARVAQIFDTVNKKIPEDIWITHWDYSFNQLKLQGCVETQKDAIKKISQFSQSLSSDPIFKKIQFEEAEVGAYDEKSPPPSLSFTLKLQL